MSGQPFYPGEPIGFDGATPPLGDTNPIFPTDANHACTLAEYYGSSLYVTAAGALTAGRLLSVPLVRGMGYDVTNACSVAFLFGGASGTTVAIAAGATIRCKCSDGANFVAIGGSGGGNTLVATAKVANFTAAAGNDYKIDARSSSFTGTMPAVTDGARISFLDTELSTATNPFSCTAVGTDKIMDPVRGTLSAAAGTVVALNRNGTSVAFEGIVSASLGSYWLVR